MSDAFEILETRLRQAATATDAAECHGFVAGVLCAAGGMDPAAWLPQLFGEVDWESPAVREAARAVAVLFQALREQINSPELEFALMLPDDERPLGERAQAMAHWCEGFTTGLGLGGLDKERPLSADSRDFLQDVSDIARVAFDFDDPAEDDEQAYMELQEYLRVGVLLLHDELQPLPTAPRVQ
jgi:yecA family protein